MCGKEFTTYRSELRRGGGRYCSVACSNRAHTGPGSSLWQGGKIPRTCFRCGKLFFAYPSRVRVGHAKYCSRECAGGLPRVSVTCARCGRVFIACPSESRKYCSKSCANGDPPTTRFCECCGKLFVVHVCDIRSGRGRFCSVRCANRSLVGSGASNWRGGKSFEPYCFKFTTNLKESVRDRFGRTCFLCPTTEEENGRKLCVHHVDYNKGQGCGHAWSLLPLCDSCHSRTNYNRWYWFGLLNCYWAYNPLINFHTVILYIDTPKPR